VQFRQLHITSSFIGRNFLHSTSLENILKLYFIRNATDHGTKKRYNL